MLWPNNLCLNKHILPINYATQVNPTHPVTYSKIVGEWLVGRAVLIEGEQNIFKKKIFQILKGLNCFYRNYFSGIIFQELFSVGEDGRKTDVKRTNSYWAKFTSN